MAITVFVNNREICCKASSGTSICAFPDVCLSPPSPPAGPIPIPYPNTAKASDATDGSKTVKVGGKAVMLKDKSCFKSSTGDEAAGKALGMGVISHTIQGKVYFASWSMDVKIEGENAIRHLDIATHNHNSAPGNTPPWPHISSPGLPAPPGDCGKNAQAERDACDGYKPYGSKDPCKQVVKKKTGEAWPMPVAPEKSEEITKAIAAVADPKSPKGKRDINNLKAKHRRSDEYKTYRQDREDWYHAWAAENDKNACLRARRCQLKSYDAGCCPDQTPHHLVEASAFHDQGRGPDDGSVLLKDWQGYQAGKAPCVCVEGPGHGIGTHGLMHTFQSAAATKCPKGPLQTINGDEVFRQSKKGKEHFHVTTFGEAAKSGAQTLKTVFPESKCDEACLEAQIVHEHQEMQKKKDGSRPSEEEIKKRKLKAVHTCNPNEGRVKDAEKRIEARQELIRDSKSTNSATAIDAFTVE